MKIRKTQYYFFQIILSVLLILYAIYQFQFSDEQHKIGLGIILSFVGIFGLLIKIILGLIFPEIILDENGIKILGRNKIEWKVIQNIIVKEENQDSIKIIIEKSNGKRIIESFKNLNFSTEKLEDMFKFYIENFGIIRRNR